MTQKELLNGKEFHFNNEQWCEDNLSDDVRGGFIHFNDRFNVFAIHFNGKCIQAVKTFQPAKKRLEKLFKVWNLQFVDNDEF